MDGASKAKSKVDDLAQHRGSKFVNIIRGKPSFTETDFEQID
jgi:hypothetical protein